MEQETIVGGDLTLPLAEQDSDASSSPQSLESSGPDPEMVEPASEETSQDCSPEMSEASPRARV